METFSSEDTSSIKKNLSKDPEI